jgi:cleavage and polyadenylation specificity factor subunit 1
MKWKRVGEKKPASGKALGADDLGDMDVEDMYEMLDDDVDDDLYGGGTTDLSSARQDNVLESSQALQTKTKGEYIFQTHDRLINIGPFRAVTLGKPLFPAEDREKQRGAHPELEIVTTTGPTETSEDAGISVIRRSIAPQVVGRFEFPACKALWTVRARSAKATPSAPATDAAATGEQEQKRSAEEDYERYLFVSKEGESQVFHVNDTFEEVKGTDFETDGETLEVGIVGDGSRLVQVVAEQVRVYDCGACPFSGNTRCFLLLIFSPGSSAM